MKRLVTALMGVAMCMSASAQSRYFGYFASGEAAADVAPHVNTVVIWATMADRTAAQNKILGELAVAKSRGVRAIVGVDAFLFRSSATSGMMTCPFTQELNSGALWSSLVAALTSNGYLVAGNPGASTVAGFYVIDEPELCGLTDVNSAAHPAVANAVATIRNHASTAAFPLVTTMSKKYLGAYQAMRLMNWVGLDNYSVSDSEYLNQLTTLQSKLSSTQRSIMVPQAAYGGFMATYGYWHDPDLMFERFRTDTKIVMLMPFLWSSHATSGVRDLPILREAYTAIGTHIKTGGALPLKASVACTFAGNDAFDCFAQATRGTAPYRFQFSNGDVNTYGQTTVFAPCGTSAPVSVTIRDAAGIQRTASTVVSCSPGELPR